MPRSRTISMDAVRFGSMIRRIRTDCGWTRRRLARRAGLSERYLGILETGGNVPTLTTILELTEVLGADVGEIMRQLAIARAPRKPQITPPEVEPEGGGVDETDDDAQ